MLGIIIILLVVLWLACLPSGSGTTTNHDEKTTSDKDVWSTMGRAQCQCLTCQKIVYIPTQYLERRYGVQNSKCPNCGWKMTKVKIVQTWGIK